MKIEWRLSPPTEGVLRGVWGDYQRMVHPRYYRKDGQLKWWAKRQLAKRQRQVKKRQRSK